MRHIKISDKLYKAATRASKINERTIEQQIELWIKLGMNVEQMLTKEEIKALVGVRNKGVLRIIKLRVLMIPHQEKNE